MGQQHEEVLAEFNTYLNPAYRRLTWRFLGKADGDVVKVISATRRSPVFSSSWV